MRYAIDCVSDRGADSPSLQFSVGAMGPAGGRVISLVGQDQEKLKEAVREGVEVKCKPFCSFALMFGWPHDRLRIQSP